MMTLIAALVLVSGHDSRGRGVVLASYLGVPIRHGSIYEKVQWFWARSLVLAGGVRHEVHDPERIEQRGRLCLRGESRQLVRRVHARQCAAALEFRGQGRVAEDSDFRPWRRGCRHHLRRATESSRGDARCTRRRRVRIREGASVVVFAEGTRGDSYALRPFKKGPFVLAISAGVPIIPVVIMGTREVMARGQWHRAPRHSEPAFPRADSDGGLTYADRERLIAQVWTSMADTLSPEYGIESDRRNAIGTDEGRRSAGAARATRSR